MRPLFFGLLLLLPGIASPAHSSEPVSLHELFEPYAAVLEAHLGEVDLGHDGLISAFDYDAALADPDTAERLSEQRDRLADFSPDALTQRETAIAFWLNAYNFFMIAHILEERPEGELVESVWDYGGRFNPFRANVFERELFRIGEGDYSLDNMEKDILLGEDYQDRGWKDARVHFAVNCASVGCPPLRQVIYTADNVDDLLEENTRRAFNTPYQLRVDGNTLYLTSLFDWYEDDYREEAGSIRSYIEQHADERVRNLIRDTERIRFIDYDWRLNRPENFAEWPAED